MTVMLYRPADKPNPACWHLPVEHKVFAANDVPAALDDGWALHPDDFVSGKPGEMVAVVALEPKRKGRPPKEG